MISKIITGISLPASSDLFAVIEEIHRCICDIAAKDSSDNVLYLYESMFNTARVDCESQYAAKLGYSWEILEKMGGSQPEKKVPSFLCQLMELESPEMAYYFYQKYWRPLIPDISDLSKDLFEKYG